MAAIDLATQELFILIENPLKFVSDGTSDKKS